MASLGTVYWEEADKERVVTGLCARCQTIHRDELLTLGDVMIVSPRGMGHLTGETGESTACGINATGDEWWHRL